MPRAIDMLREGHRAFTENHAQAALDLMHPEVEWQTSAQFAGLDPVYRGHDGVREWMREVKDAWERFDVQIAEVVFDRDDRCGIVERLDGRGRASGVEVTLDLFSAYTLEDGKLVRRETFTDRAALEAAGAQT